MSTVCPSFNAAASVVGPELCPSRLDAVVELVFVAAAAMGLEHRSRIMELS